MTDALPAAVADGRDDLPFMVHSQLDDLDLNPFEFRVYAHMVRRAGNEKGQGEHWESVTKSAKHCRMDPKTYRAALQGLVQRRLVTREDRVGQTSVYRLTSPKVWRPLPDTAGVPNQGGVPETVGVPLPDTAGLPLPNTVDKGNPLKGIPRRESQPRARGAKRKAKTQAFDAAAIPLPDFVSRDKWQAWTEHLKGLGKRITEPSAKAMLEFLGKTPLEADQLLRTAVSRNWAALYPLDKPRNGSPEPPARPKPKTAEGDWRELLRIHSTGRWNATTLSDAGKSALEAIGGWTAIYADDPTELENARQEFLQHHALSTSTQEETAA